MKILELLNAQKLKENLVSTAKRFPFGIILIFLITILCFIILRGDLTYLQQEDLARGVFSAVITFFFSIGVYIAAENISTPKINTHLFQVIPLVFGILFFFTFKTTYQDFDQMIYFILTLTGIVGFLFVAPYIKQLFQKNDTQNTYYNYFYNLSVVFLISAILGGVLFALGVIGLTAIFALFDLKDIISEKIYGDWAILSLSLITPIFALTQLPSHHSQGTSLFTQNAFFSFLVKYIAIPFIYIYFVILYAYSVKVLLHFQEWPKGEVSWMVIGFSVFGYLIYMFSYIFEAQNKYISFFRKCFPFVVIPQLFMLFYAIGLRIGQYDLTMNRYFVVIFGIWLAVISVYFIVSKSKNIQAIPAILTLFTVIISIGPWGVYSLPETRQLQRLQDNLEKAGILSIKMIPQKTLTITPLKNYEDIDKDLSKEIYNGIDYLCNYNNCQTIKVLFHEIYDELERKRKENFETGTQSTSIGLKDEKHSVEGNSENRYVEASRWEIVSEITQAIKVKSYFENYDQSENETLYFYSDTTQSLFPLDIQGYSKIYRFNEYYYGTKQEPNVKLDLNKQTFEFTFEPGKTDTLDIKPIIEKITQDYQAKKSLTLSKDLTIYEVSGKNGKYKIFLENISLKNPLYKGKPTENSYASIGGYLLAK